MGPKSHVSSTGPWLHALRILQAGRSPDAEEWVSHLW